MKNNGFVIEPRKIMSNEWYTEPCTMHLLRHCRLRANYTDAKWKGIELKRGQFVTSLNSLSEETGLSVRQIRTALKKLEETGYVTSKTSNKNRIITVLNYDSNLQSDKQNDRQTANRRQADDKQATTDNNNKKENKNKNNNNNYYHRETNRKRNCSFDLAEVMKIDTLDFLDGKDCED